MWSIGLELPLCEAFSQLLLVYVLILQVGRMNEDEERRGKKRKEKV